MSNNIRDCQGLQSGAIIDWCTVTFLPSDRDADIGIIMLQWLRTLATGRNGKPVGLMGEGCPGMRGYSNGMRIYAAVMLDDGYKSVNIGRVDWGGDRFQGRARLDLSGAGCALIKDWQSFHDQIDTWDQVTLTRVDVAVDCLDGEYTVDDAAAWYKAGEFHAGGRVPRHSTPGDWLSDQPEHGRTLEIGRRTNGKMLRAYEKGRQLGDTTSPWTRFEVEIRNKDRDIPLDILINPDTYFAGAYKCLEQILSVAATRIKTDQAEGLISIERLMEYCRIAYGKALHVTRLHLSSDEILEVLARPGIPARLDKASVAGLPSFGDALRANHIEELSKWL